MSQETARRADWTVKLGNVVASRGVNPHREGDIASSDHRLDAAIACEARKAMGFPSRLILYPHATGVCSARFGPTTYYAETVG